VVIVSRFGNARFDDLKKFQEKLNKLNETEANGFIEACAKELAARLLAKVIKRTPVGGYDKQVSSKPSTGKKGGTYVIEIVNPVDYASYVEFGHRTRNHKGWVQGKFMLTISEQELEVSAPKILERKLEKKLGEVFK
jgi:hypothetical protein